MASQFDFNWKSPMYVPPELVTWQDLSASLVSNGMIPDVLAGAFDYVPDPILQQAVAHIKKSKLAQ